LITNKTIFFSALDWGLGHATRCVPIIRALEKNNKIIIGVTPLTRIIFDEEFPQLEKINVPAYNIKYSSVFPLWLKLLLDWPGISRVIKEENNLLRKIISENKIDAVISDSRFGLYSKKVKSIFITHQLFLKTPFANSISQKLNRNYILNFDEIWIPDFEDNEKSLSCELSHGEHFHHTVKYIGPKSRLVKKENSGKKYDYLFLISGPEPQQSILKKLLIEKCKNYPILRFAVVLPKHKAYETEQGHPHLDFFLSPDNNRLSELISQSEKIICRSGYSTLMDLHFLNKKNIILVPTPGQTEQEYLAQYWKENFNCKVLDQKKIPDFEL
jgi:spore coat polysaccharide biosynthesis predicted glycosyltransferase SpsG